VVLPIKAMSDFTLDDGTRIDSLLKQPVKDEPTAT
jgi:hypothetical protein